MCQKYVIDRVQNEGIGSVKEINKFKVIFSKINAALRLIFNNRVLKVKI